MSSVPASQVETILVVDGDVLIRMFIAGFLRDCGFKIIEAANADEALKILQQAEVQIDLVFTDVDLPGEMDGFGLSQWIRQTLPGVEVMLSGSPARAAHAVAGLCNSGSVVSKPYDANAVLDEIRRLLATRGRRPSP